MIMNLLKALTISILFVFLINFSSSWLVYKTLPYKWYLQSEKKLEPKFYGGEYFQINDTIRVVKKKSTLDKHYNTVVVQNKNVKDTVWCNTEASYFENQNLSKIKGMLFLQSQYEEIQRKKAVKSFFN